MRGGCTEGGFSLIEVLVTLVILLVGLLGLVGLQSRAFGSHMEGYQRTQALLLVNDMASRLNANRKNAAAYVTGAAALGTGDAQPDSCAGLAGRDLDFCEWSLALKGAAETKDGQRVGAMIGARGCIYNTVATMPRQYVVMVVWQGMNATAAPALDCGQGRYGADDGFRRAITVPVTIGVLG